MHESQSLSIQSVLYGNPADDIVRGVRALTNATSVASSVLSSWEIALGDSSEIPVLSESLVAELSKEVSAVGGSLRYDFFGANLGHGGGHNRLAPGSSSDLILVLNPDALVGAEAVLELVLAVSGDVGAADGRQIPIDHPKSYDPVTGEVSWASGACLMTTRAAFEAVGGFDHQSFFLYSDDVDFSWRVKLHGLRVVHVPSARVFHDKRLTVTGDWPATPAEIYYSAESALLLAHKYSRPDIVKKITKAFRHDGSETPTRALAEFQSRMAAGTLPAPIDADHKVGQFVSGNYAKHRY